MSHREQVIREYSSGSLTSTVTRHTDEIRALRAESMRLIREVTPENATREQAIVVASFLAAAALLEVHDDTGISLDDWTGPRQLVEVCLDGIGYPDGTFLENGV